MFKPTASYIGMMGSETAQHYPFDCYHESAQLARS